MSTSEWTDQQKAERELIEARLRTEGINPEEKDWSLGEDDDRPQVALGEWAVVEDDEDRGLYSGDHGPVHATCVGAEGYGNLQVAFYFVAHGTAEGMSVVIFDDVEPVG